MFTIAFLIGSLAYLILLFGVLGLLYLNIIATVLIVFLIFILFFLKSRIFYFKNIFKFDKQSKFVLLIILTQAAVNLIGALGPEIGFDALWYHLTLPKIYLQNNSIFHINGSLLYYSDIPKNVEMIFLSVMPFGEEIAAKLVHYLFGILTLISIYKISIKFVKTKYALLSCLMFYSSLVVGWESVSAYVDLGAAFFTTVSFYLFLNWIDSKRNKDLITFSIITGFSLATKTTLIFLVPIYTILILKVLYKSNIKFKIILKSASIFILTSILVGIPWYLFSFFNTGNPFYPIFEKSFVTIDYNLINTFRNLILPQDPVNPLYIAIFPLVLVYFNKLNFKLRIIAIFCMLSFFSWVLYSNTSGIRLLLPFLPLFSVLTVIIIGMLEEYHKNILIIIILLVSFSSIGYRFIANYKFIPVVLRLESKKTFLTKNLNYSFGDFYDTDGYFEKNIKKTDRILLYGFHNLYYVNFPYIDSSFAVGGDRFNYIATQNSNLPVRFKDWKKIYYNSLTKVGLYSLGGVSWEY